MAAIPKFKIKDLKKVLNQKVFLNNYNIKIADDDNDDDFLDCLLSVQPLVLIVVIYFFKLSIALRPGPPVRVREVPPP